MTIVCDTASQWILAADVCRGPGNDSPRFPACMRDAARRASVKRVLADSGYDCEAHHQLCREELGIPEVVIALAPRNSRGKVCTPYRRRMKKALKGGRYGQRWQSESAFSRMKRRLGDCLASRGFDNQADEVFMKVLTYNLMIILLSLYKTYRFFAKPAGTFTRFSTEQPETCNFPFTVTVT